MPTQLASTKPLITGETASALTKNSDGSVCPGASTWREAGLPYYSCSFYLRQRFGQRVQKVSIDGGSLPAGFYLVVVEKDGMLLGTIGAHHIR